MSTGAKVALGVGGTYVAGQAGIHLLAHHLLNNSQQAKEISKIRAEKAVSNAEAEAVEEHLQNEIERLDKAKAKKTVSNMKRILKSDNAQASLQKIKTLQAQQEKALKEGRVTDADKLGEQINTMNESMKTELIKIDSLTGRHEIEDYVDNRKGLLQHKIEGIDRKLQGGSTDELTDAQFDEAAEEVNSPEVASKLEENAGLEAEEYTESFLSHTLV